MGNDNSANPALPRNPLAQTLGAGGLGLAMIIKQVESPNVAMVAKAAGYDAIYIDLEYGVIPELASSLISVSARKAGISPLIRIPSADPECATRCLNAGALGIVVPKIKSIDQVRAMVKACKCAPYGERPVDESWFAATPTAWTMQEKQSIMNSLTTLIIMLESPEALELVDEIAALPGVDILHIGTSDLSDSLGIPNQFDQPEIERAFTRLIDACRRHGKIPGGGGLGTNQNVTRRVIQMGVRFITAGNEWAFMTSAATERAAALRALLLPAAGTQL
jgi:2-keto-3-deoxy-L-rhamnonate aldolase RhmA